MKKRFLLMSLFISLILSLSILSGCVKLNDNNERPSTPEVLKIGDYFPIRDNVRYVYEGVGNEFATHEVFVEYTSEDKIQQRVDNGGTVLARVFQVKDGKLTRLLSQGETYYRENLLDKRDEAEEILLMEPLEEGTTWTLKDGRERRINSISAQVTTPLGSYEAIEVITEGTNDSVTDYYVKDVGLIKSVFHSDDYEVSSFLKALEEDATRIQVIQFYFPNINDGKIYFRNKEVNFRTNDITSQILEEAYKGAIADSWGDVFTTNTKINSLSVNDENKVELDLNSGFVSEMNAGSAYESMILQSIANTFGQYYGAQEVILTIEGKPYVSGHEQMVEGQSISVDYKNAIELDI